MARHALLEEDRRDVLVEGDHACHRGLSRVIARRRPLTGAQQAEADRKDAVATDHAGKDTLRAVGSEECEGQGRDRRSDTIREAGAYASCAPDGAVAGRGARASKIRAAADDENGRRATDTRPVAANQDRGHLILTGIDPLDWKLVSDCRILAV